jgi:hypothetical protein
MVFFPVSGFEIKKAPNTTGVLEAKNVVMRFT